MGRLRQLELSAARRRKIKIRKTHIDNLKLCLKFLQKCHEGVNINLTTFRTPTHAYFSEACPAGIGGYNHMGKAWRWKLPEDLKFRATINMLEHVSSTIGPWIDIIDQNLPQMSCVVSIADSTTSAGWLRKSNFNDDGDTDKHMLGKFQTARSHALRMLK